PPDLSATNRDVHPGVDRIVRHCLEKNPEERFHSAHHLAFDLEALSGVSTPSGVTTSAVARVRRRSLIAPLAIAAGVASALAVGFLVGRQTGGTPPAAFHPLP